MTQIRALAAATAAAPAAATDAALAAAPVAATAAASSVVPAAALDDAPAPARATTGKTSISCLGPLSKDVDAEAKRGAVLVGAYAAARYNGREFSTRILAAAASDISMLTAADPTTLSNNAARITGDLLDEGINPFGDAHLPQSAAAAAVAKHFAVANKEQRALTQLEKSKLISMADRYWHGLARLDRNRTPSTNDYEAAANLEDYETTADVDHASDEQEAQQEAAVQAEVAANPIQSKPSASDCLAWRMLLPLSKGAGCDIASGSCARADAILQRIPSLGGTGLLRKGPLRRAVRVMVSTGLVSDLPTDWPTYAPPGPGCRATVDDLQLAASSHHAVQVAKAGAHYSSSPAITASYERKLLELHNWLGEDRRRAFEEVSGRPWLLHNTQCACCYFSKYSKVRRALLDESRDVPNRVRFYKNASGWQESFQCLPCGERLLAEPW